MVHTGAKFITLVFLIPGSDELSQPQSHKHIIGNKYSFKKSELNILNYLILYSLQCTSPQKWKDFSSGRQTHTVIFPSVWFRALAVARLEFLFKNIYNASFSLVKISEKEVFHTDCIWRKSILYGSSEAKHSLTQKLLLAFVRERKQQCWWNEVWSLCWEME